jgi:hypothetical protein
MKATLAWLLVLAAASMAARAPIRLIRTRAPRRTGARTRLTEGTVTIHRDGTFEIEPVSRDRSPPMATQDRAIV